jgi:hypothetical protein
MKKSHFEILLDIFLFFLTPLVLILLLSCSQQSLWETQITWDQTLEELPGQQEYPNVAAIIIVDEGNLEVYGGNQLGFSEIERHKVIKILQNRGRKFADVYIPYKPATEISDIKARTISPDGKITILEENEIYDVTLYPSFVFYSDQRAKIFTMPAVEDGTIIEYQYKLRNKRRTIGHIWNFQSEIPVLLSNFTIEYPSNWPVNYRIHGLDLKPDSVGAPLGFKSSMRWKATDIPPLTMEFGMPSLNELYAQLIILPLGINSWEDVSQWYYELSEPKIQKDQAIKKLSSDLTEGVTHDEEKLKVIYEWVRDHIRYIAVDIGVGGFQPHPSGEILEHRYGDCKDMTTLLCALAREAGIETYQALISTRPNGFADTTLPSPSQFNHVIAYSPIGDNCGIWMDATEKGCSFGQLPWYDQGMFSLVVGKDGNHQIIQTPYMPSDSNKSIISWHGKLFENGNVDIKGKTSFWGVLASEVRGALFSFSFDEQRRWVESYLASKCSGICLDTFHIAGLQPVNDPLTIFYEFSSSSFGLIHSDEMLIRTSTISSLDLPDYFRAEKRVHPVRFNYGLCEIMSLNLEVPSSFYPESELFSDSVSTNFGKAFWLYEFNDGLLKIKNGFSVKGNEIAADNYIEFRNFLDKVRSGDLQDIVLRK